MSNYPLLTLVKLDEKIALKIPYYYLSNFSSLAIRCILLITITLSLSHSIVGQNKIEKIPIFNIGVKLGTPGLASAGLETNLPILQHRLAPFIELHSLKHREGEALLKSKFLEYGINLYFSSTGDKGYFSISRSHLNISGHESHEGQDDSIDLPLNLTNAKIGGKWGKKIYFRVELGFSFGEIPESITVKTTYKDGTIEYEEEEFLGEFDYLSELLSHGLPIFNIGFGIRL